MNHINLVLIAIIAYIGYLIIKQNNTKKEHMESVGKVKVPKSRCAKHQSSEILIDELIDDINNWETLSRKGDVIEKNIVKDNFIETQFHNDYRDVISALNDLVPSHKQIFNVANIPLKYSEPDHNEVTGMTTDFIETLNNTVKKVVSKVRNNNTGWDEPLEDPAVESGWDKIQRGLGNVPVHTRPLGKTNITLVSIEQVQKYETEGEIKYTCRIIIQKEGADDQMLLKVSFVVDKSNMTDEDNFFQLRNVEMDVTLEEAFIEGYLSDYGSDSRKQYELVKNKFYQLDNMEHNNMTDPKYIQNELLKHHRKREKEAEYRNSLLDEEGRDFHHNLPNVGKYSSYDVTQTIFDDMNNKNRSFS